MSEEKFEKLCLLILGVAFLFFIYLMSRGN